MEQKQDLPKLIFGTAPRTFDLPVEVPTPDGLRGALFVCRHFAQSDWTAMRDAHVEAITQYFDAEIAKRRTAAEEAFEAKAKLTKGSKKAVTPEEREQAVAALVAPMKTAEVESARARFAAQLLHKVFTTWEFEIPYSLEALEKFLDFYPTASDAIFEQYNTAINGRRLGNSAR